MFCALEYDRAKPKNSLLVGQELYFAWRSSVTKESRNYVRILRSDKVCPSVDSFAQTLSADTSSNAASENG
jgi:hypothetical protein